MKIWIHVISKRVLFLSQMDRWLRHFARDCRCLEKSGNPQRENCPAELPRQTTNRGRNQARTLRHTPAKEDTKVCSARKVLNIQYSSTRGKRTDSRSETDGCGCMEQFHFSYFLLFRVLFVGARGREGWKGERVVSRRYFLLTMRLASRAIPSYPACSHRDFAETVLGTLQIFPVEDFEEIPKRVRCFSMNRLEGTSAMQTPLPLFFLPRTISPEIKPLQARPFPTSPQSTIESRELRLYSCESFVLQSLARRIVRQTRKFR